MMQVNLLPWRAEQDRSWRNRWCWQLSLTLAATLLLITLSASQLARSHNRLVAGQQRVQQQQQLLQTLIAGRRSHLQQQRRWQQQLTEADALRQQNQQRLARMTRLAEWLPANAWLVTLRDGEQLYLQGHSGDYAAIVELLGRLRTQPELEAVELDEAGVVAADGTLRFALSVPIDNASAGDVSMKNRVGDETP